MFKSKKTNGDTQMTEKEALALVKDEAKLKDALKSKEKEASDILQDEDKFERFIQRLEKKLKCIPTIGKELSMIPALVSLVRSYVKKEYKDIPLGSVISIMAALVYFVSPIDLIPDPIPVIGYLDDIAVLALCLKLVRDDVKEYEAWRKKNGKEINFEL